MIRRHRNGTADEVLVDASGDEFVGYWIKHPGQEGVKLDCAWQYDDPGEHAAVIDAFYQFNFSVADCDSWILGRRWPHAEPLADVMTARRRLLGYMLAGDSHGAEDMVRRLQTLMSIDQKLMPVVRRAREAHAKRVAGGVKAQSKSPVKVAKRTAREAIIDAHPKMPARELGRMANCCATTVDRRREATKKPR